MGKLMEDEENPPKSIREAHDEIMQKRGWKPKYWEDIAQQLISQSFKSGRVLTLETKYKEI